MRFVLASGNEHKAAEIARMLPEGIDIVTQGSLGVGSVPETGLTFIENALIKARHAAAETGLPSIADDSGICCEALGGAPGIYSARYAGSDASDAANVEKLLGALGPGVSRAAFFYCVLVCLRTPDDPTPLVAEGRWHGTIAGQAAGGGGFGYDPVFIPDGADETAAELSPDEKNAISHRGIALHKLSGLILEHFAI